MQRNKKQRRPSNSGSKLLTVIENQQLFNFLGPNRISLAAGSVVEYFQDFNGSWKGQHNGVLSFVKDYENKQYTLILVDVSNWRQFWEKIM
jgi:hypothetical protein